MSSSIDRRAFDRLMKQLPYAMSKALNKTAEDARAHLRGRIARVFDRPTAMTLDSIKLIYAKKNNLQATIYVRDEASKGNPPVKYLFAEVEGGERRTKRWENQLQRSGVMPKGTKAVPTRWCPLDGFGNVPASYLIRMISILRGWGEQGYQANETGKTRARRHKREYGGTEDYFSTVHQFTRGRSTKHLPQGIYLHVNAGSSGRDNYIRPIFMFVSSTRYHVRLRFYWEIKLIVGRTFQKNFEEALADAIRTAR